MKKLLLFFLWMRCMTMYAQPIDTFITHSMEQAIENGSYPNIHSVLVSQHGKLIYEKYWPGKDQHWGDDLGIITHEKDSLHDIRSISKSIVSACTGIAIDLGKIKDADQKVFDFFPEYSRLDTGIKSLLTIKHLLTMSSGLSWNEEVPYDNPENSEVKMIRSANPVEYVLSQPMDFPPGKVWKYNGGTTQLLAAIIERTTGMKINVFADKYLFQPIGIKSFEWVKYSRTGLFAAASGLRLRSRDLLNFGLLYNSDGRWNNQQVISANWIEESRLPHVGRNHERPEEGSYGYQFWLWQDTLVGKPISITACVGNGDQRIFMDKGNDLVIVVTAGNYNLWNIKKNAYALVRDYIYPALFKN